MPPPPLHDGPPIAGRNAVRQFWGETLSRFDESRITNLSIEKTTPAQFVRTTTMLDHDAEGKLRYTIRQVTELQHGRVSRRVTSCCRR
jgi:hypothetical protein